MPIEGLAEEIVHMIVDGYTFFDTHFRSVTAGASDRFTNRQWWNLQNDAARRLELYSDFVDAVTRRVRDTLEEDAQDHAVWSAANTKYAAFADGRSDPEIARTFFNSITRRMFHTVGVDSDIEFVLAEPVSEEPPLRALTGPVVPSEVVGWALDGMNLERPWADRAADIAAAAERIASAAGSVIGEAEFLVPVFYRGRGAYIVGRIRGEGAWVPVALSIHNHDDGLVIDAVMVGVADLSILFSYTRSSFFVDVGRPGSLVAYLQDLLPQKPRAELYTVIGYHKHGKTEFFSDFVQYVVSTKERFEYPPGTAGLVMVVFTMPGYDVVFKVIRDRFAFPKQTTRTQVMGKYKLVFRHERAGRLIDAQEFEHLRFARSRFSEELLDELAREATRAVSIGGDDVTIHHTYVERRVEPLDLYLRRVEPDAASRAVIDYGDAIKNLAASNIFPGDMLVKNFGVTRNERVVFYDYDELVLLEDCRFRRLPEAASIDDEMLAEPMYGVGENDIFPEEFRQFMGMSAGLRDEFERRHGDLFDVGFWQGMQQRIGAGEVVEILPYSEEERLPGRRSAAAS